MTRFVRTAGWSFAMAVLGLSAATQARPSQWWSVAQGADRALFVNETWIERDGDVVRYGASQTLRFPLTATTAQVNDLAVTIIGATSKALRYKVERKKADAYGFPEAGG